MNTQQTKEEKVRVNLTLPKTLVEEIRHNERNISISTFITEAMQEKIKQEKREAAFKRIIAGPPTFLQIKDSVAYVRELRDENRKRDKRLGLI